jgi:hypothetical protein
MEEGYTELGTVLTDERPEDSEGDGVIVVGRFKGDPYDGVQLSYDASRGVQNECLKINIFWSLTQAGVVISDWKEDCNHGR